MHKTINTIGSTIEVVDSMNKTLIGVKGVIVDETKNLFVIKVNDAQKKIIKKNQEFKIKNIIINGTDLIGKPEERFKKWLKKNKQR